MSVTVFDTSLQDQVEPSQRALQGEVHRCGRDPSPALWVGSDWRKYWPVPCFWPMIGRDEVPASRINQSVTGILIAPRDWFRFI